MSRARPPAISSRPPLPAVLAVLVLLANSATAVPADAPDGEAPLTNEDIVRLVMTGTDEKAIADLIAERRVDFDLDTEMIAELRTAGVGEAVLEAMRRRQAAMPRPRLDPLPPPDRGTTGTLLVSFAAPPAGEDKAEHSLIAAKTIPKGAPVPRDLEVGLVDDLALAVICTTSHHVPDHWDTRSALEGAPRHALLLFAPGAAAARKKGFEILYLDYAEEYRIEVPEGRHALQFVAAGRGLGSGAWRLLAADGADVVVSEGRVTPIRIEARSRLRGNYRTGFGLDVRWSVVAEGSSTGGTP